MAQQPKDFAALFRGKAEEARTIAESMANTSARDAVLKVAAAWDRLAEQEEKDRKKPFTRSN
jgi:hypothetical protein